MARPIAETSMLIGEDAARFERLRTEVESLTKEQRVENTRKLKEAAYKAKKISPSAFIAKTVNIVHFKDWTQFS